MHRDRRRQPDDNGGSHSWCKGSWGATECTGSNKCSATAAIGLGNPNRLISNPKLNMPETAVGPGNFKSN